MTDSEDPKLSPNERGLSLLIAILLSSLSTYCGINVDANLGSISYTELARAFGYIIVDHPGQEGNTQQLISSGSPLLYLWFLIPAIVIAPLVARHTQRTDLSGALSATLKGYVVGICFTLLSLGLYYSELFSRLRSLEDFSNSPSILSVISDWQALSGAAIAALLYFLTAAIFGALRKKAHSSSEF